MFEYIHYFLKHKIFYIKENHSVHSRDIDLRSAHTERQRQRPIQSQWKRQTKRQAAPLKFAACRSVWVSP